MLREIVRLGEVQVVCQKLVVIFMQLFRQFKKTEIPNKILGISNLSVGMKCFFLLAIFLFVLNNGCHKNTKRNTSLKTQKIVLNNKGNILEVILPDSIFESVSYIKLETTEESLIHTIGKIIIDQMIYILDTEQNVIYIYDTNGRYLNKLDKQGGGPQEFQAINDFLVDSNYIYVLSRPSKEIKLYRRNQNLEFIERFKLDDFYSEFSKTGNCFYLYGDFQFSNLKNIAVYNYKTGKIENKYKDFPGSQLGIGQSSLLFFNKEDTIYATFPYEYSIFRLTNSELYEILTFDFGRGMMFPSNLREASSDERKKYYYNLNANDRPIGEIDHLVVTNSHYLFSFNYLESNFTTIQNRNSGDYLKGYLLQTSKFPLVTPFIYYYQNEKIIQTVEYADILNMLEVNPDVDIPVHIRNGEHEDNPIIALYTLKTKYR